jgi:hypothetical protein
VRLTGADERAYTQYAETETYKGFEDVDVQFRDRKSGSPSAPGAPGAPEHKADAESGVTKQ